MSLENSIETGVELPAPPATSSDFGTNIGEEIENSTRASQSLAVGDFSGSQRSRCNLGAAEKKVRIATGTALLGVAAFAPLSRGWRIGLAVAGASQLITGAMSYCPLWQALGIDTRHAGER